MMKKKCLHCFYMIFSKVVLVVYGKMALSSCHCRIWHSRKSHKLVKYHNNKNSMINSHY